MVSPITIQRFEGAASLVLAVLLFGATDVTWWWFTFLLLALGAGARST